MRSTLSRFTARNRNHLNLALRHAEILYIMSYPSIRPVILQQGMKPMVEEFSILRMIARDMPHKGICEEFGLVYKATTEDGRTYTEINYKPVTRLRSN